MSTVTESIYSGSVIVPLADVQHIESWAKHSVPGIKVISKHTRWDFEHDEWANSIWISDPEAVGFRRAWCRYRSEIEAEIHPLQAALTLIASFENKTLIAPSFGPDYDKGHQAGANAAFNSAASLAKSALTSTDGTTDTADTQEPK